MKIFSTFSKHEEKDAILVLVSFIERMKNVIKYSLSLLTTDDKREWLDLVLKDCVCRNLSRWILTRDCDKSYGTSLCSRVQLPLVGRLQLDKKTNVDEGNIWLTIEKSSHHKFI